MDASRTRDASPCPIGFIGDLHDPWVAAIADAIATTRPVRRVRSTRPLTDDPFGESATPDAIVVHRHQFAAGDAGRLAAWREADHPPTLVIVISPYVRYEELERWSSLADIVVSEAIAADVLPGRLARCLDCSTRLPPPPGCRIEVAGGTDELSRALVDVCTRAGYPALAVDERTIDGASTGIADDTKTSPDGRLLTLWELPILEPGWSDGLARRSRRTGPVIALAGFADRSVVARARAAGAAACLELPCDLDDLIDVVDRVARLAMEGSRPLPARPEPPHRLPPPRRNPRRHRDLVAPTRWPDDRPPPTIPGRLDRE
jgi:hypothetical protein